MVGVYSFSYSFRTLNATFDHTEVFFSLFISFDELYDQPEIPFIQSQFQRFLYQTHKCKIQNISDGIFILSPGSCPTGGTLGRWGCPGGSKKMFFKHGHVEYQIDWDDDQNRMQVKFSS